jgi:hypothetical protein
LAIFYSYPLTYFISFTQFDKAPRNAILSIIMLEEAVGEQPSVKETLRPEDVVAYIDQKIEGLQPGSAQQLAEEKKLGTLTVDVGKEPEKAAEMLRSQAEDRRASVREEIERLEAMKKAVARGEHRGVAAELEKDCQVERQGLEDQRQDLQGELKGDREFFELQEQINRGKKILGQLTDAKDRGWVQNVIGQLEAKQGTTERRRKVVMMRVTQKRIDHLKVLQQFVSSRIPGATPT